MVFLVTPYTDLLTTTDTSNVTPDTPPTSPDTKAGKDSPTPITGDPTPLSQAEALLVEEPCQVPVKWLHPHEESQSPADRNIEDQVKELEDEYANLVGCVREALDRKKILPSKVLRWITELPVSLKTQYGESLRNESSTLCKASTIQELFLLLSLYWDFWNCGLLVHIVRRFKDQDTEQLMEEYLKKLKGFFEHTKVGDFIDKWASIMPPNASEIIIKMGDKWRDKTLHELEQFRIHFTRSVWLHECVTQTKRVKTSSVILHCTLLTSVPENVIHEFECLRQFFQQNHVLKIHVNGVCILNLETTQVTIIYNYDVVVKRSCLTETRESTL